MPAGALLFQSWFKHYEQTSTRITYHPQNLDEEVREFRSGYPEFLKTIASFNDVPEEMRKRFIIYLSEVSHENN